MPSQSWRGGSTRAWRRVRALVLANNLLPPPHGNNGMCTLAIPGVCTGKAEHVHHTQGRSVTGDDPRYLVASCAPCNLRIGDPTKHADPKNKPVTKW